MLTNALLCLCIPNIPRDDEVIKINVKMMILDKQLGVLSKFTFHPKTTIRMVKVELENVYHIPVHKQLMCIIENG